jgi:hypothetical protein
MTIKLSETFKGIIWKLVLSHDSNLIAVESRQPEDRQVVFSILNYESGAVLFKDVRVEESWFAALAHVHENLVFITGYESEKSPVSKGITAINTNNQVQWQRFNYSFYDAWAEGLRVYNPNVSPRRFEWLHYQTGESIMISNPTPIKLDIQIPTVCSKTAILSGLSDTEITGDAMTLTYRDKTICCFHELFQGNLRLKLFILLDGNILFEEILMEQIQKQQLETFFIHKDHLFYIRNSNQIVSYNLV